VDDVPLQGLLGILFILGLCWLLSEDRRAVAWRLVAAGLLVQLLVAFAFLKVPLLSGLLESLNGAVLILEESTRTGTAVVFGYLAGTSLPFEETVPGASYILAFRGLPLLLVMSALSALLFHWRVLPWIVRGFAWALRRTLRIGGAEGLGVAANVFVGMVEAPLLIRPYLSRVSRSELFSIMTVGMATIAGTVMVLYATIVGSVIPHALVHILTASVISAPAAVVLAKILVPEQGEPTEARLETQDSHGSAMDAITQGTAQGVQLLISVVAMIIVLVSLVAIVNAVLGFLPAVAGAPLSLERMLGWIMAPLMWLVGISWQDAPTAGSLMATKTVLNELIAYLGLADAELGERSRLLLMYALCGFANPGSLGIMIGGLGTMAPDRRAEIVELGLRSIVAGTLTTCMTAAVASLIL
jgi:CNT family concentrative nucleoside transporter